MATKSFCMKVLGQVDEEDLVFAAEYYGLPKSGPKSKLAARICKFVNGDTDTLIGRDGPFAVSFWNEILTDCDGSPQRSYRGVVDELTKIFGCDSDDSDMDDFAGSDVVKIHWHEDATTLDKIHDLPDIERGFYALVEEIHVSRGVYDHKLLYVGIAFDQPVVKRIRQQHQAYEALGASNYLVKRARKGIKSEILFMVGEVVASSKVRTTRKLYEDVENLLIARHQPKLNKKKKSYTGRDKLVVLNVGDHAPLRPTCFG